MLSLSATERSCWVTLLCYACAANEKGVVRYVDNDILLLNSGVKRFNETGGVTHDETLLKPLETFQKMEMITLDNGVITLVNWQKRQSKYSKNYARLKKWRKKKQIETLSDNGKKRCREEEIRKEEIDKSEAKLPTLPKAVKTKRFKISLEDLRMVTLLSSLIKKNNPDWVMESKSESWAEDINKIHRIDKRTYEQIEFMIKWVQNDTFWSQNILSALKLREKFNELIPKCKASTYKARPKTAVITPVKP